ncbi:unnamed protein product [Paramecium sonneborni]|uniref:Uncharacterized protein n=1 Tax=Paramecium sonneborni TaxID=65129 RepID=A0A8S1QNM5_9CILI|nr:unnamed protein product [Paramecium sonneborni]
MDKELIIDCQQNKESIRQYLNQTRKAQNDILLKKYPQYLNIQTSKYGIRQPIQLKNPLLIKSLFQTKKIFKERDTSLPICTLKTLPAQPILLFQTDRIHSRCPALKNLRLKSGFRQTRHSPEEYIRIETAPAVCRSPVVQKPSYSNLFKTQICNDKKQKPKESQFNKNEWGIGGWNIIDDNFDTKLFID